MHKHLGALLSAGALSIVLASCDSYKVLDQFYKGSPLSLALETASVQQGETINLYPSGGTSPYSFGLLAGDLFYVGTLGSISGQTYTAGNAIGTVVIYLSDASGATVDAVATIVPPTPASFTIAPSGTNAILISWSCTNTALISGFLIQRSSDDVTFTNVASQPSSATSYLDSPLNPNQTYYYGCTPSPALSPILSSHSRQGCWDQCRRFGAAAYGAVASPASGLSINSKEA